MAKDQTFLTDSQIKEDIKKRHSVQKIGIELEMYSAVGIDNTYSHISNNLGFDNWECVSDGSLYDFQEVITEEVNNNGDSASVSGEELLISLYTHVGNDFSRLVDLLNQNGIADDLYSDLLNSRINPNQYFHAMGNRPDMREFALGYLSNNDNTRHTRRETVINRKGVEARVICPMSMGQAQEKLKEMVEISKDSTIKPVFSNPENGNVDNEEMSGENHGMAGLHFHFGLSQQINYSVLDLLRLLKNVHAREHEVENKSLRPLNRWCKSVEPIINSISNHIDKLTTSTRSRKKGSLSVITKWFQDSHRFSLSDPRYYGINVTNIGYGKRNNGNKKFNTIEFRWGSAELVKDEKKLQEYYDMLVNMVDMSFTGSKVMQWEGYTLKDISDSCRIGNTNRNVIAVISNEGKLLGRIEFPELCHSFTAKVPSKIEKIYNDTILDNSTPKFESISRRKLSKVIKEKKREKNEFILEFKKFKKENDKNNINKLIKTMIRDDSQNSDPGLSIFMESVGHATHRMVFTDEPEPVADYHIR